MTSEAEKDLIDTETVARICKALGHPARIKIVQYLQKTSRCICGDIVDLLPLAQSTVSQHLKSLKAAGLIQGEVEGPCTCYCLNRNVFQNFKRMMDQL